MHAKKYNCKILIPSIYWKWNDFQITQIGFLSSNVKNFNYKILQYVKDSNADSEVIFKFLQTSPIIKAVSTKISKKIFCIFGNILIFLRENKEWSFLLLWIGISAKTDIVQPEPFMIMEGFQLSNPHLYLTILHKILIFPISITLLVQVFRWPKKYLLLIQHSRPSRDS